MFINLLPERKVECNSGSAKQRYTESDRVHFHGFELLYKYWISLKKHTHKEKLVYSIESCISIEVGGGGFQSEVYM